MVDLDEYRLPFQAMLILFCILDFVDHNLFVIVILDAD